MSFNKLKGSNKTTGICKLAANSDMTIYSAATNHSSLMEFYNDFKTFHIDLSDVEDIDSTGAQILLALERSAKNDRKEVFLHSPSASVTDVLNVLCVKDQLTWQEGDSHE